MIWPQQRSRGPKSPPKGQCSSDSWLWQGGSSQRAWPSTTEEAARALPDSRNRLWASAFPGPPTPGGGSSFHFQGPVIRPHKGQKEQLKERRGDKVSEELQHPPSWSLRGSLKVGEDEFYHGLDYSPLIIDRIVFNAKWRDYSFIIQER